MKLQLVFILGLAFFAELVFAVSSEVKDEKLEGVIDDIVNQTINDILAKIVEPVEIIELPLNFNSSLLSGYANITNFKLEGLKTIVASYINVQVLNMALDAIINVPSFKIVTDYDMNVTIGKLIPFYGEGSISVAIHNINISLGGQANLTDGISLNNVTVSFTLGDATFDLHGILNNEELSLLISDVLNDVVVNFINGHTQLISNLISSIAEELINSILNGGGNSTEVVQLKQTIEEIQLNS
ncbi:uncharacterized protein [Euwallacea fornicatus]|uniref:uncharacterized protein n=1 Tax=Euwallacea fornicatus TaxID=995702 RepID=UPI0033901D7D